MLSVLQLYLKIKRYSNMQCILNLFLDEYYTNGNKMLVDYKLVTCLFWSFGSLFSVVGMTVEVRTCFAGSLLI